MKRQRGFGAIAAIVVLVILAALSAAIVSVGSSQHMTSAQDIQSARAWHAARAGNEWGLYQALRVPGTFSQVTTTITITRNDHGYINGGTVYLDFGSANDNLDNQYTVANAAANSFTVTSSVSQTANGTVNFCIASDTLESVVTGFNVTVTCESRGFNEGESAPGTPQTVGIYSIKAVACPAAICPATDATVAGAGYVERTRVVLATN